MRKRVFAAIIFVLLLLVACKSETTGKRVAAPALSTQPVATTPTGNVVTEPVDDGRSAAEVLQDLQNNPETVGTPTTSGDFYPPITSDATGKEALKERTRALMSTSTYDPQVDADDSSGARYANGLPGEYGKSESDSD